MSGKDLHVGFDVGSETVYAVVLDQDYRIELVLPPFMHFGNPFNALAEANDEILRQLGPSRIKGFGFTGFSGKLVAETSGNPFWYDTITLSKGARFLAPAARYVVHLGSKDPYFFEMESGEAGEPGCVSDHGTGTKCGGGSGILISKQARRFFTEAVPVSIAIEEGSEDERAALRRQNRRVLQTQMEGIHRLAELCMTSSDKYLDVGGRCGVIIQSDMIHMQNSGEQIKNILMGMYTRVAKNYRCDVLGTRSLVPGARAIATGGAFLNRSLARVFSAELGLELVLPEHFDKVGAFGAAVKSVETANESWFDPASLKEAVAAQKAGISFAPPLASVLDRVVDIKDKEATSRTAGGLTLFRELQGKVPVVIGLDGGSTTTKAVVADADDLAILAEICLDTDGKPLETAQKIFAELRDALAERIQVEAIAYTGSSGAFYYKLFTNHALDPGADGTDLVKDEISCHAAGVKLFDSRVDTIFECGGQDAKFTVFGRDGNVQKAKMNLSCMAGTGQSMKNMLDMLGFDFSSFEKYALAASRTPVTDEMCAIFTEAGVLKLVALGFPKEEVAAAIAYGFMGGYANKFVGSETFGTYASAQGGPFKGKACLAALALHTGALINAFPHRQLFGALGAAAVARARVREIRARGGQPLLRWKGFSLASAVFDKSVAQCSTVISDSCGLRDCRLQIYGHGNDRIFSGGLCPKGNTEATGKRSPDYVSLYKTMVDKEIRKYAILPEETDPSDGPRVLIPRSLHFLNERSVFMCAFYKNLGFKVVVSPESNDLIADLGIARSHSEACYPSKLHNGHAAYLQRWLRPGVDKMLLINFLGKGEKGAAQNQSKTCPYISGAGFAAKEAIKLQSSDALLPLIFFNDPFYPAEADFAADLRRAFADAPQQGRFTVRRVRKALKDAERVQAEFLEKVYATGESIVQRLKDKKETIYLGIGRGYTLFDDKASSRIHDLFIANGLHFIPSFFLRKPEDDFSGIVHHMYWYQGREMVRYALRTALDPAFYGVRETNFNCGPDAMLSYHETKLFDNAHKPYLTLQTDGHNSNAQFGTRTMAFNEVVKNHVPVTVSLDDLKTPESKADGFDKRLMGIPNMGTESSDSLAAVFRSIGCNAELMPTMTRESNFWARKYLITNNCLPMHILFGDSFAWLKQKEAEGMDPNRDLALFIPMAGGPCRLGQYHIITRYFLDLAGYDKVPIVNPAAYLDWENIPLPRRKIAALRKGIAKSVIGSDILYDARLRTRPYEINPGETDRVFDELHREFIAIVEAGSNIKALDALMAKARDACLKIPVKEGRFPLVGLFGEIFVRSHTGSNEESIRMLERHGLEVSPRLIAEMMEYNNHMQTAAFLKERRFKSWFIAINRGLYMRIVGKRLLAPLAEYLGDRIRLRPIEVYNILRKHNIFDIRIKGEAGISIGTTYNMMDGNPERLHGVYHLEPFGCMQECVAVSKIRSLIDLKRSRSSAMADRIIPYMVGVFGDSELPNLEAEVAMFAEKCHARREAQEKAAVS
jgi:activator of 2-hydroxyglutaryl-CoA dehydratase/predicted nucleotide-binding protein (sugar kinase/HSP70/actin superfamily)